MSDNKGWTISYITQYDEECICISYEQVPKFIIECKKGSVIERNIVGMIVMLNANRINIELLEQSLGGLSEQLEPLKKLARTAADHSFNGYDFDGCSIQEQMATLGLLIPKEIDEETDRGSIINGEDFEIGDTYYVLVDWLKEPEAPKVGKSITIKVMDEICDKPTVPFTAAPQPSGGVMLHRGTKVTRLPDESEESQ